MAIINSLHDNLGKAVVDNMALKSVLDFISQLSSVVETVRTQDKAELQQAINTLQQTLNDKVAQLQSEIDEVKTLAEILNDYEKGQIEQILETVLQKLANQGLLDRLCVQTPEGNISIKDLLGKIIYAEKIIAEDLQFDQSTNEITGIVLTISDGLNTRTEVLTKTSEQDETDNNGNLLYKRLIFQTDNWGGKKGVTVTKEIRYIPKQVTVSIGKQVVQQVVPLYKGESKIVLNLQVAACPYTTSTDKAIEQAADINQDGTIGPTTNTQQSDTTQTSNTSNSNNTTSNGQ